MRLLLLLALIGILGAIFILVLLPIFQGQKNLNGTLQKIGIDSDKSKSQETSGDPDKMGNSLSNNQCQGTEKRKLGTLPMNYGDFSMIIPYGLVVGDHVTPIDHQYFSPIIFHSPRDSYEVRAMADATIVSIEPRVKPEYTEYRLIFSISCKLFYYYDLVTSLAADIQKEFQSHGRDVKVPVKEGQVIGKIGGQTLDFAVWDMDVTLKGFVNPKSYEEERWKIHTVDPLDYYTDDLKKQALSKYIRTAPPVSGKIDYDIDGKLIGNWFKEGTNGYQGTKRQAVQNYSQTHLAVVPNHLDPSIYMASFGNFAGQFKQFVIKEASPDPKEVGVSSGLVKYGLAEFEFIKEDGSHWDGMSFAKNIKIKATNAAGCVLYQLIQEQKLKMEAFPGVSCGSVSGFGTQASIYTR